MEMKSIIIIGATGAAGRQVLNALLTLESKVSKITILGRRKIDNLPDTKISIEQYEIDIFDPTSYKSYLGRHNVAICTLGVGEPSSVSKEQFIKTDKTAVVDFANTCKSAGIRHFEILSSVDANDKARTFYLKVKGELNEELKRIRFERLSIFQPSLIITPNNRFGISQWLMLKTAPFLNYLLVGSLKKYRGVPVESLGKAIAFNMFTDKSGIESLHWSEFVELVETHR